MKKRFLCMMIGLLSLGAAVKDEYINGSNVRKFILPAQNHLVTFHSNTDKTQCDAIRAMLDAVLAAPTDLEEVESQNGTEPVESRKVVRDGQIVIRRGDKTYTLTGQEIQ